MEKTYEKQHNIRKNDNNMEENNNYSIKADKVDK